MKYVIVKGSDQTHIEFDGDITFSENVTFREMLKELSEDTHKTCVFDLSQVGMIDSAGLGMFLIAKEQAEKEGWAISVKGASGHVASMLQLTKLSALLDDQ